MVRPLYYSHVPAVSLGHPYHNGGKRKPPCDQDGYGLLCHISSHLVYLQHLIPIVIDHLHGNLAGFGRVEGAADSGVER